jgi:hypothetical protein
MDLTSHRFIVTLLRLQFIPGLVLMVVVVEVERCANVSKESIVRGAVVHRDVYLVVLTDDVKCGGVPPDRVCRVV